MQLIPNWIKRLWSKWFSKPQPTYSFMPTKNFFSQQFKSEYIAGLTYTVRSGNADLDTAVQEWAHNGRVTLVPMNPKQAQSSHVKGKGTVK